MKPLRILCITRAYAENAGGMERLSFELIQELSKLPALQVTVLKRHGTSRVGAILFVLGSIPLTLLKAPHADVIHLGDPVLALHGWLIRKLFKKPVAVTIHGLDVTFSNPFYQAYLKLFGHFDLCLSISQYAEGLLKKSVVSCQSSVVINPGVYDRYFDPSLTRHDLEKVLQKSITYNLSPTTSVLLTVGRLVPRKGHAWFIENVLPHLPENTVYVIAGEGPEKKHIQKLVDANKKILFLSRVSDADLKILYNTVDAFIQPNSSIKDDAEGFGLVLLEAALCQRPVFAANLDGIPDAIHHEKNGVLIPAGDVSAWRSALEKQLTPSSKAREYTRQNFGWAAQAEKYKKVLAEITA